MIAIVPGYISRSVAGSYDNEGIAIFCMLLTYYLWIKSVKTGQIYWAALCSMAYFYMVSSILSVSCSWGRCYYKTLNITGGTTIYYNSYCLGVVMGWIRVSDKFDTTTCLHSNDLRKILS